MAKQTNFWTQDSDGERWLINGPELVIATNRPRKKGKRKMYANRPKHGTKAWMSYIRGLRTKKNGGGRKHKRKAAKRNMYSAGMLANRPRTRTITKHVHHRARHNPPKMLAGLGLGSLPGMEPIAGAFAGLAVPPLLNYLVKGYLPTTLTSSKWGSYAVSAAEVILPSWIVRKYVNRNVGTTMLVVGIGALLYSIAKDVAPQIFGLSGMGFQPMLGAYTQNRRGLPAMRSVPMMQSPMQSGVPTRLDSGSRF